MMLEGGSKRILYVLDEYPSLSQTFVHNEIVQLRQSGWIVDILTLREGEAGSGSLNENVDFMRRPPWAGVAKAAAWWCVRHPRRCLRLLRRLRELRFQYAKYALLAVPALSRKYLLHNYVRCHCHFMWGASAVASYLAALLDVPVSATAHARDLYTDDGSLQVKLQNLDLLVTVCDFNVDWLKEHQYELPPMAVIRCGVVIPPIGERSVRDIDIISVARLVPKKGIDVLLQAVAELRDEMPDLRVQIVGDGTERAGLEQMIEDLGLRSNVELVGARPHDETLALVARARVFALPCRETSDGDRDAFPVVLWEAMARCVPIVTTDVAGIPEVVSEEVGWLVPPDSADALAKALLAALVDDDDASRRAATARERVELCGDLTKEVSKLSALFTGAPVRNG